MTNDQMLETILGGPKKASTDDANTAWWDGLESELDGAVSPRKPQGFAALSPERRSEISALGGKKAHALGKAHVWTSGEAGIAGKKGGSSRPAPTTTELLDNLEKL